MLLVTSTSTINQRDQLWDSSLLEGLASPVSTKSLLAENILVSDFCLDYINFVFDFVLFSKI